MAQHNSFLNRTRNTELSVKRFAYVLFRYQRGSRSLAANLSMSQSTVVTAEVETQEQEEDYDIPEEVETVIGQLLNAI